MYPTPLWYGKRRRRAAFSPADVAGLQIWLDAALGLYQDDAGTTPADANADPVGLWQDQSGNGLHVSQATAGNKPALTSSGINSLPVVTFSTDNYLLNSDAAIATAFAGTDKPFTVFAVVDKTTAAGTHTLWSLADKDSSAGWVRVNTDVTPEWVVGKQDDSGMGVAPTGGTPDTDPAIVTAVCSGATVTLRDNGAIAINAQNLNVGVSSHDRLAVGALVRSSIGNYWEGHIAEFIAYNVDVGSTAIGNVESYLASKYGITLA